MKRYALSEKVAEQLQFTASITITYGRGRNIRHEIKNFKSREDAIAFGKNHLDNDDNVSRYTVHDFPIFDC